MTNELIAARAEIDRLRAALHPFVAAGQWLIDSGRERCGGVQVIKADIGGPDEPVTYSHFIQAAKIMKDIA